MPETFSFPLSSLGDSCDQEKKKHRCNLSVSISVVRIHVAKTRVRAVNRPDSAHVGAQQIRNSASVARRRPLMRESLIRRGDWPRLSVDEYFERIYRNLVR